MTPKEKAKEIINGLTIVFPNEKEMDFYNSFIEDSAIKIIKEIIYELTDHKDRIFMSQRIDFWQDVINEIN
jgi:hypothetical protein